MNPHDLFIKPAIFWQTIVNLYAAAARKIERWKFCMHQIYGAGNKNVTAILQNLSYQ